MNQPDTDHWFEVTRRFERLTNEQLQAEGRRMLQAIQYEDGVKQRYNITHLPGWSGHYARPAAGIIKVLLLIRGVNPSF